MKRILPTPTPSNPFAQIDYIFNLVADGKYSKSTKSNYTTALSFYKKFLKSTSNYNLDLKKTKLVYLNKHFDELILVNLKQYIKETNIKGSDGYLTSHTIMTIFSATRGVFKTAINLGFIPINSMIEESITGVERETEASTTYSTKEMNQIKKAIKEELKYVYKVYRRDGYRRTGVGRDPREKKGLYTNIDNMRWYFENILECSPILSSPANLVNHKAFIEYFSKNNQMGIKSLRGLYRHWGVTALIDSNIIMPLVVQLAILTGLNVQSLFELKVDCFDEKNKLSGVPVLKYYKARSTGHKEMHLDLEDSKTELKEFRQEQVKAIQNLITITKSITEIIRSEASEDIKDNLFLVQSASNHNLGEIGVLSNTTSSAWSKKFVKRYQLKNDKNEILAFNLKRFRPTRATDLIRQGADLIELQHEMGHGSILTTLDYVDKNKLNNEANHETTKALEKIHENRGWAESNQIRYVNKKDDVAEGTVFKGILCDCKNPFNPPNDVKILKSYKDGDVCSRVNMCLFCDNVMIFKRNLPTLWMYKRQIDRTIDMNDVDLPNQQYYLKTLNIINQLFDKENSEFTDFDLNEAKEIAENLDEFIDPITFQAIDEDI